MARRKAIPNWLSVFGAPEIIAVDKESISDGEVFQGFRTSLNSPLQSVIPGHPQSLGNNERRRGQFRMITDHTMGTKSE